METEYKKNYQFKEDLVALAKKEWQPIETAPAREGGIAFLTDGERTVAAFWGYNLFNRKGRWCSLSGNHYPIDIKPTLWHQFWPDPPSNA